MMRAVLAGFIGALLFTLTANAPRAFAQAAQSAPAVDVLAALVGQPLSTASVTATTTGGNGFTCNSALASCFDPGPGSCNSFGTNVSGEIVLGGSACAPTIRVGGGGNVTIKGSGVDYVNAFVDFGFNSTIGNSYANKPVWVNDTDGLYLQPYSAASLPTCGGSGVPEGTIRTVLAASSSRGRVCVCTSDGAGTPAYSWRNLLDPSTAGTSTTCPATP